MTDHLPECPANWGVGAMPDGPCIFCEMLRACEERVLEDLPAVLFGHGDEKTVLQIRDTGYAAGVQAAREAVAAVSVRKDTSHDMRVQALAAIDALRGES